MKLRKVIETEVPNGQCCECGVKLDTASGECVPRPGDMTLCINCASLNIFGDDLRIRSPTLDEFLAAAANSELQAMRRTILRVQAEIGANRKRP